MTLAEASQQAAEMATLREKWKARGVFPIRVPPDYFSTSCKPDVRFAPVQATPGDARAFEIGYRDHPRFIGPDSKPYRDGYNLAAKHEQTNADARGEDLWIARGGCME